MKWRNAWLMQDATETGAGAQRVLSTEAGHSLSPGAQAELRALAAAAKTAPADVPIGRKAAASQVAAAAAGSGELATSLTATDSSPEKAASRGCTAPEQPLLVPGLPPLRSSLLTTKSAAPSVACGNDTAVNLDEPRPSSTVPHVPFAPGGGAPVDGRLPAAPLDVPASGSAAHGLPALQTVSTREARRRLAFQPAAADTADAGGDDPDDEQALRRTLAVPNDLATLAAGSTRPV